MADARGGLVLPICCSDFGFLVTALALDVAQAHGRFVLAGEPLAGSVRVWTQAAADGGATARVPVQFDAAARPGEGTRVFITYSAR